MAHVLLIEPDTALARIYIEALKNERHSVDHSVSAQNAIDAADKKTPDLVVLELQLVRHGGIEFLYEFRSYPEWQNIPVVVLSNVPPAEFGLSKSVLVDQLGVRAYQYKPATKLPKLIKVVNEQIKVTS